MEEDGESRDGDIEVPRPRPRPWQVTTKPGRTLRQEKSLLTLSGVERRAGLRRFFHPQARCMYTVGWNDAGSGLDAEVPAVLEAPGEEHAGSE